MKGEFLRITDFEEVESLLENIPVEKKVEKVQLGDAYRRVLAEDLYANMNLPPFNRSIMDGYAVKAEDTFRAGEDNPVILKLLENVEAGIVPTRKIEKGTCIGVNTGAPIPKGADAVVMVEFTENKDSDVYVYESAGFGQNIAREGSDIEKGKLLLKRGTLITHNKIGVLGAMGLKEIPVFQIPKIAVISTGNEIIEHDQELEYGQIYDVNSLTISNGVKACGCVPIHSRIVKDNYDDLKNKITEYLDADIIITSGSTSYGTADILRTVLDDMGKVFVHGIAMKPGKPTMIGEVEGKVIFGLPGNPVAALMIFHVFVAPFLMKMASILDYTKNTETVNLKISRRFHSTRGRKQYALVKIEDDTAYPILRDSGAIASFTKADGYFEIEKNVEIVQEGSEIEVTLLESW